MFVAKIEAQWYFVGASAFIGLGGYVYFSGKSQLDKQAQLIARKGGSVTGVKRRIFATGILSLSFIGMGVYRLIN